MRHEYCEKNGVMITYSDEDVAFEEIDSAKATVCYFPFPASVLSNRFYKCAESTQGGDPGRSDISRSQA